MRVSFSEMRCSSWSWRRACSAIRWYICARPSPITYNSAKPKEITDEDKVIEAFKINVKPEDVVIVPAFGAKVSTVDAIKARGCQIVDTTCGDVMSVWKRVRQNATEQVTSIIHGKSAHEETMATASRALGRDGKGHYLVVLGPCVQVHSRRGRQGAFPQ